MRDIEPTGRATVLVCITCRTPTDPSDAPRAGLALAKAAGQVLSHQHRTRSAIVKHVPSSPNGKNLPLAGASLPLL